MNKLKNIKRRVKMDLMMRKKEKRARVVMMDLVMRKKRKKKKKVAKTILIMRNELINTKKYFLNYKFI